MAEMNASATATRGANEMLLPIIVIGAAAIGLLVFGYVRGKGEHIDGLRRAKDMMIPVLPLLLFAFIVAGMAQAPVPRTTVSHWVGKESGL